MKSWEHYVKAVTEHLVIPYQKRAKNKIAYISSINEITTIANNAYSMGEMAPGISVSRPQNFFGDWNSSYWAMYNLINMHRRAYDIITTRIKTSRITTIPVTADNTTLGGFTLGFKTSNDEPAYDRAIDWILKMVFDPIIHGKWSESVEDFFDGKHFYINNGADWRGSFPPTDKKAFYKPEMNTCDLIAYHIYNSCYTSLIDNKNTYIPVKDILDDTNGIRQKLYGKGTSPDDFINNIYIYGGWEIDAGFAQEPSYIDPIYENCINKDV